MTAIRPYNQKDAAALSTLMRRAILEVGIRDYSISQVTAWAERVANAEQFRARAHDGRTTLVATDNNDAPLAFIDLQPDGHIDLFFCLPESIGTGLAATLYDAIEQTAKNQKIHTLTVEASEAAKRLLLKKGFTVTERQDFEVNGVAIHNYTMEKPLA